MKVQCARPKAQIIPVNSRNESNWFTKDGNLSYLQPTRPTTKVVRNLKFQNQIALPLF